MKGKWLVKTQLLFVITMLTAVIGHKLKFIPFEFLVYLFALALIGLLLVGVVSVCIVLWKVVRGGDVKGAFIQSVIAVIIVGFPLGSMLLSVGSAGFKAPKIHDITTDVVNPPLFNKALDLRSKSENTLVYPGEPNITLQQQAYPDIKPLYLDYSVADSYALVQKAVQNMGLETVSDDPAQFILEAVEETVLIGFKDDMVVRVLSHGEGSVIDVRSVSRVGVSDLGANAKRIRRFFMELKKLQ
jgi:uncharacterized protein (DUF1499 family)